MPFFINNTKNILCLQKLIHLRKSLKVKKVLTKTIQSSDFNVVSSSASIILPSKSKNGKSQKNEVEDDDSESEDEDKGREWTLKYVKIDDDENVGLTSIT